MFSWLARPFQSASTWIALGVLAPLGMLLVSGLMLLDLRRDAWDKAEQTSRNLLQVVERDVARNVEIIDLSLAGVVEKLRAPGIATATPDMRQFILFDRLTSAKDLGVVLVVDENGQSILDAAGFPPRAINNADRSYFQAHKAQAGLGLLVSEPLVSRLTGARAVVLSRRIDKPDGSFGGVVLGSLNLAYFTRLFDRIGLGRDGAISLFHHDGVRLVQYPERGGEVGASIAGTQIHAQLLSAPAGSFVARSSRDGIERHYAFTQIGDLPLTVSVALSTAEIEAEWREKALVLGCVVLLLCGLTVGLSLSFGRELRRRAAMQAELERLSFADPLTGLPNRRALEQALVRMSEGGTGRAARALGRLSLLAIDADHFKRYNDRYGHAVGDAVLIELARGLTASVRAGDLVCRVGGEEFVALLPETDQAAALQVAARIHAAVAQLAVPDAGIEPGSVTVSIGLASAGPETASAAELSRRADAALYEAKAAGRNRTCCAPVSGAPAAPGHGAGIVPAVSGQA